MNRPPQRPWHRTDPQWSAAHHRASAVTGPPALMVLQVRTALAELRGAGPLRLALGSVGILTILYGADLVLTNPQASHPIKLGTWLLAAVLIHDGIVAPATVAFGWALAWVVRGRAQAYVQAALAIGAVTTVVAIPEIYRRGKSAPGQALLERNYALNLGIIVAVVIAVLLAVAVVTGAVHRHTAAEQDL